MGIRHEDLDDGKPSFLKGSKHDDHEHGHDHPQYGPLTKLQPSDFSQGGQHDKPGNGGSGNTIPDPNSKGSGPSFDDPHGPKTVGGIFKPHG